MIISPPFLLTRNANEADADYMARCMPDTSVVVRDANIPEGSFPVSFQLGWHGGLHLQVPLEGTTRQNVHAIADGEIVYARRPTQHNDTLEDPRNYNPYGDTAAWTDDGCVVIRHRTQIGANAEGQAVEVEFFSIYEHLSALLDPALRVAQATTPNPDRRVWRKDEIGTAGQVYGREHQLHFEIVCNDANLQRLINRQTGDLNTGANGRSNTVFGELYFRLPAGTAIYPSRPLDNNPVAHHRPPDTPADVPLAATQTTREVLYVGLRYAAGDGAANQRGHAYVATYREDGTPHGVALAEANAEYDLYTRANEISGSYPAGGRPAPSAAYELLRFGRIIDTVHVTLNPANVPHWRRIRTPEGEGWVNLNADGVNKFSDADFPQWKGWRLIDDDTDADSRCESAMISRMIEDPANADGQLTRAELLQRLRLPEVREKLKRAICKFPTELNQATIEERWGWLRDDAEFGLGEYYDEFAAHVGALAIPWDEANWLPNSHWHFQPREFITTWRKCGWLAMDEAFQLFPSHALRRDNHGIWLNEQVQPGRARLQRHLPSLNKSCRRYGIVTPLRQAAFYANAMQETMWFGTLSEGNPGGNWYHPWHGRGFLQLTHPDNYIKYWRFIGRTVSHNAETVLITAKTNADNLRQALARPVAERTAAQNGYVRAASNAIPAIVRANEYLTRVDNNANVVASGVVAWRNELISDQVNSYHPANSAGVYWAWSGAAAAADQWPQNVRATVGTGTNTFMYYTSAGMGRVAGTVNVGHPTNNYATINGIQARFQAYTSSVMVLMDTITFPNANAVPQPNPENYIQRRP